MSVYTKFIGLNSNIFNTIISNLHLYNNIHSIFDHGFDSVKFVQVDGYGLLATLIDYK